MGAVEQSSGVVESYLSSLEESYGPFSINQQTVFMSPDRYAEERGSGDTVEIQVKVENEDSEVLHVTDGGIPRLPSTTVSIDESLEPTAKSMVANEAGIRCRIRDLDTVTILGLHNERNSNAETLYRLAVVFEARRERGTTTERAVWKKYETDTAKLPV